MTTPLSVVLIHRNDVERAQLRGALEALPGVEIAGERADLRAGIALAHQAHPAILVLELASPVDDVLTAATQYRYEDPDSAIFLVTEAVDPEMLLRAIRAGANEVLRKPLDRSALGQAVERAAQLRTRKHGGAAARSVYTVFSSKGGQGVTTLATNLALCLRHLATGEVALADFDYQSGDVAFMLSITPTRSLGDVLAAAKMDAASVQDALMKHPSGLLVLPQPEQLDRVDGFTGRQAGGIVEILSNTFEQTIVDAPHAINEVSLEVFDRTSVILLVVEPSVPSVRAARRSLEIFQKLNYLVRPDRVRLVVNRKSDQSAINVAQIEEALGLTVFGTVANDYAAVSEAINAGRPLCASESPSSRAGRDIMALARKLVPAAARATAAPAGEATDTDRKQGRKGLFGVRKG
jgi:pilus assembly protein CpaE